MYKNYGDVNFFDIGRLVRMVDEEKRIFHVITCDYDNDKENNYRVMTGTINISEMNSDELLDVCKYADMPCISNGDYEDHPEMLYQLAVDIFEYQPRFADDFEELWMSKNEIIDWIDHGYIDELEWDFYKDNFYEDNRNCVVEIFNGYLQGQKEVFNSLEDALEDFERRAEKGWSLTVIDM